MHSHRIKAHATAHGMHKPLRFKVMHVVLYVCVWLDQGVPVDETLQQGYGHCCMMAGSDSHTPGADTPPLDKVADSTGDANQRQMRLQMRGTGSSAATLFITATIDHMSPAVAMSRMNARSAGNLHHGTSRQR